MVKKKKQKKGNTFMIRIMQYNKIEWKLVELGTFAKENAVLPWEWARIIDCPH